MHRSSLFFSTLIIFSLSFKMHELQLSTQRQENHAFSNFQKPATCSLFKTKKRNCKKQLQPTWWFEAHNVIIVYILYYYLLTLFLLLKITYSMKILPHSSILKHAHILINIPTKLEYKKKKKHHNIIFIIFLSFSYYCEFDISWRAHPIQCYLT